MAAWRARVERERDGDREGERWEEERDVERKG